MEKLVTRKIALTVRASCCPVYTGLGIPTTDPGKSSMIIYPKISDPKISDAQRGRKGRARLDAEEPITPRRAPKWIAPCGLLMPLTTVRFGR
jgi:hypothetical protein